MAKKEVPVWVCDVCGFNTEAKHKRKLPDMWIVVHILSNNKMASSLDLCPQCHKNLHALFNNTGKVQ